MSKITISRSGTKRILIYTGEVRNLAEALHESAMQDPDIERAIMTAATAISYTNKSNQIGEEMIDMVLYPQKR